MAVDSARMTPDAPRWRRRLAYAFRRSTRLMPAVEIVTVLIALAIGTGSYFIITRQGGGHLLSPPLVALMLVAILVPVMALMVLIARRVAMGRSGRSAIGGRGRLHVRLVALFSVIAAVPTLLVVIFASLLFQYGVQFWFSDRARVVLENADRVAQAYVDDNKERVVGEIVAMAGDLREALSRNSTDDPRFAPYFAQQVAYRNLNEAAIISVGKDGVPRLIGGANLDKRPLDQRVPKPVLPLLQDGSARAFISSGDRVEALILLDKPSNTYVYAARFVDPQVIRQTSRATSALSDYNGFITRSRSLQLQFNAALLIVSLLIVGAAIWIALTVADRLVRPVSDLVDAARKIESGDLSVRVTKPRARDEVGTLANAFNRMTRKLEEQTTALVSANSLLDSRRALIEAVLSGVSAGVISLDSDRRIRLINSSAVAMLKAEEGSLVGTPLADVAPELARLLDGQEREAIVQFSAAGDPRTLAAKLVRTENGEVFTFDDITQQLGDQRRAAWSDVARRIAHEIKNPLTPIQLAAERLQRRYGREVTNDPSTFERLTGTIVRQVGDLRRMVDEFSSFARMPKPVFREEAIFDIARQSLFLHEVAHPGIMFHFDGPDVSPIVVCDRRQLGQAFTNIVKNAVEAIEQKGEEDNHVWMSIAYQDNRLVVQVADTGIGLPAERERLTEPYMTTRTRGTGLGLAIVKNIVEGHFGTIAFLDRSGGGTIVRLAFDVAALAPLAGSDEATGEIDDIRPPELTRMNG